MNELAHGNGGRPKFMYFLVPFLIWQSLNHTNFCYSKVRWVTDRGRCDMLLDMISKGEIKLFAPLPVNPTCEVEWITTAVDRALNASIFEIELFYEQPQPARFDWGGGRAVILHADVCGAKRIWP